MELSWVSSERDRSLLTFLDERLALKAKAVSSNWYYTFTTSLDLKAALRRQFEKRLLPSRLSDAINSSTFPLFDCDVDVTVQQMDIHVLQFKSLSENPRSSPCGESKLKMHEPQIVCGGLFPADQQSPSAVGPRM
jgi:hypothetical protein